MKHDGAWYLQEVYLLRNALVNVTTERDTLAARVAELEAELEAEAGHRKGLEKAYGNVSRAYELLKSVDGKR